MSGWEGIGYRYVEGIIGCLIGGSSIRDHVGRAGISIPGTGNVSIGIATTDTLTAPGCLPPPSPPVSALSETTCYTGAVYSQGENADVIRGAQYA
jgi:hypothetical protein